MQGQLHARRVGNVSGNVKERRKCMGGEGGDGTPSRPTAVGKIKCCTEILHFRSDQNDPKHHHVCYTSDINMHVVVLFHMHFLTYIYEHIINTYKYSYILSSYSYITS